LKTLPCVRAFLSINCRFFSWPTGKREHRFPWSSSDTGFICCSYSAFLHHPPEQFWWLCYLQPQMLYSFMGIITAAWLVLPEPRTANIW